MRRALSYMRSLQYASAYNLCFPWQKLNSVIQFWPEELLWQKCKTMSANTIKSPLAQVLSFRVSSGRNVSCGRIDLKGKLYPKEYKTELGSKPLTSSLNVARKLTQQGRGDSTGCRPPPPSPVPLREGRQVEIIWTRKLPPPPHWDRRAIQPNQI